MTGQLTVEEIMAYNHIVMMAQSQSLMGRIAACAAVEGTVTNPREWATQRAWMFAAQPGWADQWASAEASYTATFNQDTGARLDVVTDANILTAVQAVIAAEQGV